MSELPKEVNPGQKWFLKDVCGCKFLVITLSRDPEHEMTDLVQWWRCAKFHICEHGTGNFLGAQIVLFTPHEIYQMKYISEISIDNDYQRGYDEGFSEGSDMRDAKE